MNPEKLLSVETPEQIKSRLQEKYRVIIGRQLTPADIDTFADDIIAELMALTEEVTESYAKEIGLKLEEYKGKDLEDEAFLHYGLEKVSDLLDKAQEKLEIVREVSGFVAQNINIVHLDEVITPPEKTKESLVPGNGREFAPDMIPRLETALFVLREGGVPLGGITLMDGIVTPDMLRKTSYVTVVIPEINRLVQVCDEEGNASYIFKLSDVNVDAINRMTKPEKNDLITNQPGIGIRFSQGPHWRDRVESYLFDEIPTPEQEEITAVVPEGQEALTPQYGELDPWRGFAVDEQGRHWGTRSVISRRFARSYTMFKKRIRNPLVETRFVLDVQGRPQAGYCFEQLLGMFPEIVTERQSEKKGEWRGFWIESETGNHWSTASRLGIKFGVKDLQTIRRYARENNLHTVSIADLSGRPADAYCYEDFLQLESFLDFLTAPQVEMEGQWAGFWVDRSHKHWAPVNVLAEHFKMDYETIMHFLEYTQQPKMTIRARQGELFPAYCLEDLEASQQFKEHVNMPKAGKEGELDGYWVDDEGRHWGAPSRIALNLKSDKRTIKQLIEEHPELHIKLIKDTRGRPRSSFSYEVIRDILDSKRRK